MTDRPLAQQARIYLELLIENLTRRCQEDARLLPFIDALKAVDTSGDTRGPRPRLDHPAMLHLQRAIDTATGDPDLLQTALTTAAILDWSQLYGGGGMDEAIAEGMLAAQVAGSYGCFPSNTVATGQFLLAPNLHYPLHTHAATEIYYCLSGTLTLQHGLSGDRFDVPAGGYSITPSHRLHALWTGDEPVLLAYIWIEDISAPIWIWSEGDDNTWTRSAWTRPAGKPWQIEYTEPVTPAVQDQANGDRLSE